MSKKKQQSEVKISSRMQKIFIVAIAIFVSFNVLFPIVTTIYYSARTEGVWIAIWPTLLSGALVPIVLFGAPYMLAFNKESKSSRIFLSALMGVAGWFVYTTLEVIASIITNRIINSFQGNENSYFNISSIITTVLLLSVYIFAVIFQKNRVK